MSVPADDAFWTRVRELFQEAVSLEGTARDELLESCRDAGVRREVEELLQSHDKADGFLEFTLFDPPAVPSGQTIGPYRIVRELGIGGMGAVFLGVRDDDQFEQRVAIKLIRGGVVGASIMRRFRQERQILAKLEHPNIARLLDGGTTGNGLPYLAMEYIEGTAIDAYCDARSPSIPERLRLFLLLCDAVQYAHRNLVIHRDIKPANVLITEEGVPKLLDFGIAKLISHDTADATVTRMMTPEYASPEQLLGEPVSTASDVYSLGVLLYRLLTGAKPFDANRQPGQEPARPSSHVRALRGDLENILLMALQNDPARRYGSVEQLAADIRRYLSGHPIEARPATLAYRTIKFVRRNRVAVVAAIAIIAVTAVAFTATLREKRIAEHRFEQVRALAHSFVFEIHDAIAPLPGSTSARELLVRRALVYLDGLAAESKDNPDLEEELARAYLKIGDVQGLPYQPNLGDTGGALASYRKALAIAEGLDKLALRADAHDRVGFVLERLLEWREAMEQHQAALASRQRGGSSVAERLSLARTWIAIGDCRYVGNRWIDQRWRGVAPDHDYESALRVLSGIPPNGPYRGLLLEQIARAHQRLGGYFTGTAQIEQYGKLAIQHHDAALAALEERAKLDPLSAVAKRNAADQRVMKATAQLRLHDEKGAIDATRQAAEVLRQLAAADPTNLEAQHDLAFAYETEGSAHELLREWPEAQHSYEQALAIRKDLLTRDPANREDARGLYTIHGALAHIYEAMGNPTLAAPHRAESERLRAELGL